MNEDPEWLKLGNQVMWDSVHESLNVTNGLDLGDIQANAMPFMAACHLNACLSLSIDANWKGWHSAAICLLRQCVEALTIIEIGLQNPKYALPLLSDWSTGAKSQGELRKSLEETIWPSRGKGLWEETWTEYFGNLARALQPYAHYSPNLLGWQYVMVEQLDEDYSVVGVGPNTYDALKASRITLLHILVGWTLGRILLDSVRSKTSEDSKGKIARLGMALSESKLLFKGKNWPSQLMPHMMFKPGRSWRD
jgi:hypothetical protein